MGRKKKKKKLEAITFPNVLWSQVPERIEKLREILQGKKGLILELGAGYGEYTLYLAGQNPTSLCLAVDPKLNRLWKGAKIAITEKLENALFLGFKVAELDKILKEGQVSKIWLPFPDPYPKKRHEKRRLTNLFHLLLYRKWLEPGGKVFLKTDNKELLEYTKKNLSKIGATILQELSDIFEKTQDPEILLETRYQKEAKSAGRKIYFLGFMF